jgi:imidazolonepropionase-like amidohydrolase
VEYDPSHEYALMERAGTDFRRILAALTTNPAQRLCGDVNLATIATGNPADLTVLEDDPADAVANLTNVRYTIRGGEIIYARGPASAGPPPSVSGEP